MNFDPSPIWVTLKLAAVSVALLLVLGTPIAWWLARTRSRLKAPIEAVIALPLVLPPTVLGFYLLVLLGPLGPIGKFWLDITGTTITFSFGGLVVATVVHSLPFVVQPLQGAFEAVGRAPLEAAATLRARPLDRFFTVACPLARNGFITGGVLGFAHSLGEFGVVLMVGGSIPGETKVISIAIYEHVESMEMASAHALAAGLLAFSFIVLVAVYIVNRRINLGPSARGAR
ncbi:MAG: molybdate ABC transporter permease subunit [Alphaproteobacteria bacterium]|nr:molybdate ABC transporter permease subunit [Alphaproteobacteria bacterium]